ncbi:hypothetical protein [Halogranum rubrum]|uniref:hypothetical protein n=1 Tax=Halogranum rubrum TaxID=553466 RepID=UPI0012F7555C|nr:hypothetical protein [Halogranum salarium]
MPVQQFSAYDVIVDVIPGAIGLILVSTLLPKSAFNSLTAYSPIVSGSALLVGGYFFGRIIHSFSSRIPDLAGSANRRIRFDSLEETGFSPRLLRIFRDILLFPLKLISGFGDRSRLKNWFDKPEDSPTDVNHRTIYQVIEGLANKMGYQHKPLPEPSSMIKYGENLLYGEDSLYMKYEMLSTFFRNISVLSILFSLASVSYWYIARWGQNIRFNNWDPQIALPPEIYLFLGLFAFSIAAISYAQKTDFESRRDRAYINDLNEILNE